MNALTLMASGMLFLTMGIFFVLLIIAIAFNVKAGTKYRKVLAEKINTLRLSKMLTALGIDIDVYLSTMHAIDINSQMKRCTACANTEECDDKLREGNIDTDSIGFCNNEESLRDISNGSGQ